ncbi:MAG: hypothetical protein KTR35_05590 [Gammaproteobacteria bacterium]|nr:hypothetical protein [Gammaproteobacteria bacterium]
MTFKLYMTLPIIIAALSLGGCSSSDDDDGGSTDTGTTTSTDGNGTTDGGSTDAGAGNSDTSAIAGLWDFTETINGEIDVYYIEILADGRFFEWDYQGDSFDQGDNCYLTGEFTITSLGGDRYILQGEEVSMSVSNGELTVVTPNDGTFVLPALMGITSTDFNACT